ncbi:MAG: transcription-repair coupling factor [Puniceicoccaceae bacterium]|nr:MAG: transcription-repair coupling factor [Puniceicoccaceae bacterium]
MFSADGVTGLPAPGPEEEAVFPALSTTAMAALLLAWRAKAPPATVVVTDTPNTLDALYQDCHSLNACTLDNIHYFPAWDGPSGTDTRGGAPDLLGDRLQTLLQTSAPSPSSPHILLTTVQALMQRLPAPDQLRRDCLTLRAGMTLPPESLCETLQHLGYDFQPEVMDKSEAAKRGGVVDLWSPHHPFPLRLDFFGDEIDSIRFFDPARQRSLERVTETDILPAREHDEAVAPEATLADYLPENTRWVLFEADSLLQHAERFAQLNEEEDEAQSVLDPEDLLSLIHSRAGGGILRTGDGLDGVPLRLELYPAEGLTASRNGPGEPEALENARIALIESESSLTQKGWTVVFAFNTDGSRARFLEAYGARLPEDPRLHIVHGMIAEGFRFPALKLSVLAESDIHGIRKHTRNKYDSHSPTRKGASAAGARITELSDIQPGDWVVHIDHGIGKYLGLYEITFDGKTREVLTIEYAQGAKLHLPVGQAHLLSRYAGLGGGVTPEPHTLGGERWNRQKVIAERAVRDLAAQMLETQAKRAAMPGHTFAPDTPWQAEFEATFPFTETADQETAIAAVKRDMEDSKPMDRLICGDVGFGKTEVAMRAAFKAVMDGKQVAVLVPTTVLALQHFQTFTERMAAFPVRVDMLSRFRSAAEQKDILARARRGEIDILIGTHRITSKDVAFQDLGLVIIDEEQRFGVRHKEKLKDMRQLVDVLTLSATPIPRTLYLSLTGARDVSSIQTAPRERLPVHTDVKPFDLHLIRNTILRELNRDGQVFLLHNRVQTIHSLAQKLEQLIPEARIVTAHGQMPERRLENIMRKFSDGDADVLLCTTIIESGVDMPNVNTIIIDRADRFGLAELYQLRGRVGRYKHQAHCLLLLPPDGRISGVARERVRVLRKYSSLGAGFKIALRDLEIRGAGNLLGSEQSGHIADIGFDLYCQLLEQSIRRLKKLPPQKLVDVKIRADFLDLRPAAGESDDACCLPVTYIEDESLRVEIYRRLAGLATFGAVDEIQEELLDRFGRMPAAVQNLLQLARIRVAASLQDIRDIDVRAKKVYLTRNGNLLTPNHRLPRLHQKTAPDLLQELLELLRQMDPAPKKG